MSVVGAIAPQVRLLCVVALAGYAVLELLTLGVALTWLDPAQVEGWILGLWAGRGGAFGAAAVGMLRGWSWAEAVGAVALASVLLLLLPPWGDQILDQAPRRFFAVLVLVGLGLCGGTARTERGREDDDRNPGTWDRGAT